jgi:hypothetical protein
MRTAPFECGLAADILCFAVSLVVFAAFCRALWSYIRLNKWKSLWWLSLGVMCITGCLGAWATSQLDLTGSRGAPGPEDIRREKVFLSWAFVALIVWIVSSIGTWLFARCWSYAAMTAILIGGCLLLAWLGR